MALFDIKLFSTVLQTQTDIRVILPTPDNDPSSKETPFYDGGKRYQVLYLLHGATGDCTVWNRYSGIERYAQKYRLAVVCASVGNSFYADMAHGGKYLTYMTQELPAFIGHMFPVSHRREDTFIAGICMGGFGAFRLALETPERFARAASLSGALDVIALGAAPGVGLGGVFDPADLKPGSSNDLPALAGRLLAEGRSLPGFYQCCGTEDFLYAMNLSARDALVAQGVELTYEESPGAHDWDYWDVQIQRVLRWLPLAGSLVDA